MRPSDDQTKTAASSQEGSEDMVLPWRPSRPATDWWVQSAHKQHQAHLRSESAAHWISKVQTDQSLSQDNWMSKFFAQRFPNRKKSCAKSNPMFRWHFENDIQWTLFDGESAFPRDTHPKLWTEICTLITVHRNRWRLLTNCSSERGTREQLSTTSTVFTRKERDLTEGQSLWVWGLSLVIERGVIDGRGGWLSGVVVAIGKMSDHWLTSYDQWLVMISGAQDNLLKGTQGVPEGSHQGWSSGGGQPFNDHSLLDTPCCGFHWGGWPLPLDAPNVVAARGACGKSAFWWSACDWFHLMHARHFFCFKLGLTQFGFINHEWGWHKWGTATW